MPQRSRTSRRLAIVLTAGALGWAALVALAPLNRDALWRAAVHAAAGLVCHQGPERSFAVQGVQMPVCARCAGLYIAGAIGAAAAWAGRPRVPRRIRLLLIAALVPTAVSLVLEWTGAWPGSNVGRWAAALPAGALAGWLFVRLLREEDARTTCAMMT